jgi:O-antigen ligase
VNGNCLTISERIKSRHFSDMNYLIAVTAVPVGLSILPWLIGASPGPLAQLGAWLVSGVVLSGLLILQSARAWPQSLLLATLVSLGLAWLQYLGWAVSFSPWMAEAAPGEMLANLRQRNQFASLMALGWLAALAALAVLAGRARALTGLGITFVCLFVALLGFTDALSGSRTGLLQWVAVLGLAYVWRRSLGTGWRLVVGAAVLGYVLGVLLAPWLADWLGHGNAGLLGRASDGNAFSRLALWSNVIELIAREPLLGHGWRSLAYAHYSSDFSGARFMEMLDNAHNLPLHLAVELGLPVALGFCGLVGWLVLRNKPWAETQAVRQLAWGVLLVIGIHSMLEYPLWYGPFFMTAVICVGILCADVWRNWLLSLSDRARAAMLLGVRGLAVLLLLGTAFVAFDYHRVSQIYLVPEQRSSWYAADPLAAAKKSVLFQSHAKFAELQITALSKETAPRVLELSSELVRWSPEPRIIEKLIESSVMMGLDDIAMFHLQRYRTNYPAAHAAWSKSAQ